MPRGVGKKEGKAISSNQIAVEMAMEKAVNAVTVVKNPCGDLVNNNTCLVTVVSEKCSCAISITPPSSPM